MNPRGSNLVLVKRKTRTRRLSSINFMLVPDRQGPQPMATILAYTSPAFGNLFPILALMIELQRRGHRVVLKTLDDGVTIGRDVGVESSAIDPRIEAAVMTDWMETNGRAALKAAFNVFGRRAAYEVDDLRTRSPRFGRMQFLSMQIVGVQRRRRTRVQCHGCRSGLSHHFCDRAACRRSDRVCVRGRV
jgi:hypothetical protein